MVGYEKGTVFFGYGTKGVRKWYEKTTIWYGFSTKKFPDDVGLVRFRYGFGTVFAEVVFLW